MNAITGSGVLIIGGVERQACVQLDLASNHFVAIHGIEDLGQALQASAALASDADENLGLRQVRLYSSIGVLVCDEIAGLIPSSIRSASGCESAAARILGLQQDGKGLCVARLTPRRSLVRFRLERFVGAEVSNEIVFRAPPHSMPDRVHARVLGAEVRIHRYDEAVLVECAESLPEVAAEIIRLSLGVLAGGPLSLRCKAVGDSFELNLVTRSTRGIGPVTQDAEAFGLALEQICEFLAHRVASRGLWEVALGHYLEGLGSLSCLEMRTSHLLTCIEVIDGADTLAKEQLAELLNISMAEARMVKEVRNGLIHQGLSLSEAYANGRKMVFSYECVPVCSCPLFRPASDEVVSSNFYFWLAGQIQQAIHRLVGVSVPWHSYVRLMKTAPAQEGCG